MIKDHPHSLETAVASLIDALTMFDRVRAKQILTASPAVPGAVRRAELLIVPALEEIGRRWETGSLSLAHVYMAGRICEEFANELFDAGVADTDRATPSVAIGALIDHHALGKRIVHSMLRAAGIPVLDYGQGLTPEAIAVRAGKDGIGVLLVSCLMLPSALAVLRLREQLAALIPTPPRVIVGGAPFRLDPDLWHKVGADAGGNNAADALRLVGQHLEASA
jgi:trimethylamine corrinoid protein